MIEAVRLANTKTNKWHLRGGCAWFKKILNPVFYNKEDYETADENDDRWVGNGVCKHCEQALMR